MQDYYSAWAGLLAGSAQATTTLSPGDPLLADLSPLAAHPASAGLGALLEALVAQSAGAAEMDRMERAAALWSRLKTLVADLRQARSALESGVTDPSNTAGAVAAVAAAAQARDTILPAIQAWSQDVADFVQDAQFLAYLPASGKAADATSATWRWPELVTTRRTAALRRALLKASASQAGTALALGSVAGYATRLTYGSWRNAVVGGPPRSHALRARLTARTGGAWLRAHLPGLTPSLSAMRTQLGTGIGPKLPPELASQLAKAMKATYGKGLPGKAMPDFKAAYRHLLRHLRLLDELRFYQEAPFGAPAVPVIRPPSPPPVIVLVQATGAGPGTGGAAGGGQGGLITIQGAGGGPAGTNAGAQAYTGKSGAPWWKTVLAILVTILLGIVLGIVGALLGGPAGAAGGASLGVSIGAAFGEAIGAWQDQSADTVAQAQQALSSPDAAAVCKELFDLDSGLYTAASQFLTILKGAGLAYPETPDLVIPPFKELLAVQVREIRRPTGAVDGFVGYPASPIELAPASPATPGWPYGPGALPGNAILQPPGLALQVTAATLSLSLWRDLLGGEDTLSRRNHDLDADRGFLMACWEGQTQAQPIGLALLPYDAV